MFINLHIYPSTIEYDTRILNLTRELAEMGSISRVYIAGMGRDDLPEETALDSKRSIVRLGKRPRSEMRIVKALYFLSWFIDVFRRFKSTRIDVINCHSLAVLPLCWALKIFHRAALVYDTHELETERHGLRGISKLAYKACERLLIGQSELVIVVSQKIKDWYEERYQLKNVHLFYNVPEPSRNGAPIMDATFREKFQIPNESLVFLYQGVLGPNRGIPFTLDAFKKLDGRYHVVFLGFGKLEREIRAAAAAHPNIHYHSAVPPGHVNHYTRMADVGLSLIEPTCLSYVYSMPNKVFQYVSSGLPVIVSDLPEMADFVEKHQCGWKTPLDQNAFIQLVHGLNIKALQRTREKLPGVKSEYNWEKQGPRLREIYDELLSGIKEDKLASLAVQD